MPRPVPRRAASLGALTLLLLAVAPAAAHAQRQARAPDGRPLDASALADTALASLVRAEAAFMDATERRRIDGWVAAFADDAATFPQTGPIALGTAPIRRGMGRVLADTATHVVWHPTYAEIARSGELGYTYGYARWTGRDSTGAPVPPSFSKYVTLWRRGASGRWTVVADLGNDAKAPAGFFTPDDD